MGTIEPKKTFKTVNNDENLYFEHNNESLDLLSKHWGAESNND